MILTGLDMLYPTKQHVQELWCNLGLAGTSTVASESPGIFFDIGLQSFWYFVDAMGIILGLWSCLVSFALVVDRKSCRRIAK